ncbi:MAG: hypothetical protein M3Q48_09885, partial [Actinomycetota bacterium]|nr:hypothetical protein [Actinomycetota bacterium]
MPEAHTRRFLIVLVAACVLSGSAAHADEHDPRRRRQQVQRQQAEVASKVDVLRADERQLERALDDLDRHVSGEEARLASARQAVDAATRAVDEHQARAEATAAELQTLRGNMRSIAVRAYMRGPAEGPFAALDAATAAEAASRQHLVDVAVGRATDLSDALRAAQEDYEAERDAAEEAKRRAEERRRAVEGRLGSVERARALKQQVAESVEDRLERALAESASLEAIDRDLARQIAARQAALA